MTRSQVAPTTVIALNSSRTTRRAQLIAHNTSRSTHHAQHVALNTSRSTHRDQLIALNTSHSTHRAQHIALNTSRSTHRAPYTCPSLWLQSLDSTTRSCSSSDLTPCVFNCLHVCLDFLPLRLTLSRHSAQRLSTRHNAPPHSA